MKHIRYALATLAGVAALLGLTSLGAATAQAAETTAAPAGVVQPLTNPPGACTRDELGDWKTDRFGIIHYCTYIDGGYYWIPL
ncbi:hypothetical protein [Saccharothrix xinjiangensis]|uniref:Uncharacterized protein n=1 Tax=Saccharothrix xinjiangensis TaxID=204798 RepID=A0ABV9YDE9_9PSEU